MKIGIVTTYDEVNFGAYLQAYSLFLLLRSKGAKVELVAYKSHKYLLAEWLATYKTKKPVYFVKLLMKGFKFKRALKKMGLSKKFYSVDQINSEKYDLLVFGSDEIWNIDNCLGCVDDYYFGKGLDGKKVSYAASFGSTDKHMAAASKFVNNLLEFDNVSVRDLNSYDIMINAGYPDPYIVLDPTFLIKHEVANTKISKRYIFYYFAGVNSELDKELIVFSNKYNIEVIAFGYRHCYFKSIVVIDPFEWMGYLKNAEFVVTNMYHGTIFSVKYKKQVVVDVTEYRINKLGFLINALELNCVVYKKDMLEKMLLNPIDYVESDRILDQLVARSNEYIEKCIRD